MLSLAQPSAVCVHFQNPHLYKKKQQLCGSNLQPKTYNYSRKLAGRFFNANVLKIQNTEQPECFSSMTER